MTQGYSFTSFFKGNQSNTQSNQGTARAKSPKMVSYYMDLCRDKHITPKDLNTLSSTELSNEIEHLRSLPYPASDSQIAKIQELKREISTLQGQPKKFTDKFLSKLTGGRNGSASKLIQDLFEERKRLNAIAPATENQIETLVEWFLCPDIPFEEYNIAKKLYLEQLSYWGTEYSIPEELDNRPWRLLTPQEFAQQIKNKMTQQQANTFIAQHRGKFYEWKKTRITQNQINTIRDIEKELANIYSYKEVQLAVDEYGETFEYSDYSSRDRKTGMESAYTALDEFSLLQMSFAEATEWIYKLSAERDDASLRSIGLVEDSAQDQLNDKLKTYEPDRTRTGVATTMQEARLKEYNAISDLVFKLESVVGHEDESIHFLIKESIVDEKDDKSQLAKDAIKQLMFETVELKRGEEQARNDIGRLYTMSEDSLIATSIVEEIHQIINIYYK